MGFVVFNPLDGRHTEYETEELARDAILALSKHVLKEANICMVQATALENGDVTWLPVELTRPIEIL